MNRAGLLLLLACLAACDRPGVPALDALPEARGGVTAAPRIDGPVGNTNAGPAPQISIGSGRALTLPQAAAAEPGDITLNFVDTDIREVTAQILGTILRVNYTMDPVIRGAATLRTAAPISRTQALAALNAVLAQNGATVTQAGGIYRVVPAAAATGGLAGAAGVAGGTVIPLRFASADELAKVLQPYAGTTGRVVADPGRNALIVAGEAATREALVSLIQAFDIDVLANQSYALLPVTAGGAKDFAAAMTDAFRSGTGGALATVVRVVPMERINSILVTSTQPRYIDEARRVYALIERQRRQTVRGWNVYYLQNSRSNDIAYVLQQAFTPNKVTAVPTPRSTASGNRSGRSGLNPDSGNGGSSLGSGGSNNVARLSSTGGSSGGLGSSGGGLGSTGLGGAGAGGAQPDPAQNPANPLLGGLDPSGGGGGQAGNDDPNSIRIIPNLQNNAVLIYATPQERDTIEAMLRKIDILPLQVRIDATIAEVTLNDSLAYGTQFFFKAGINGALNFNPAAGVGSTALDALGSPFPGFLLSGPNNGQGALSALQSVTNVNVLSSPQVLVLDNETARLQVGNLVPYLTTSSQSTISSGAPVINSIDYRGTGVIMEVTPRVNSGGLVTLDISQEVSDIDQAATAASSIGSPTFLQRAINSRVVVQDGQTVGLAGLIRDTSSRGNSGIPWLKDVPLLGFLAGRQTNVRGRTELLVLITPHVVHDQRDARALTEDLRDQLINAARVPQDLNRAGPSGLPDPQRRVRRGLNLEN